VGPSIRQNEAQVEAAEARLRSSESALTQQRQTTAAAVAEARSNVESARVRLAAARESARVQPVQTNASVASAEATVRSSRASLASAQESLRLLQSATLPQSAATAQAQLAQAKVNFENANTEYQRQQRLFEKGFAARNAVETAQNTLEAARATLATAQTKLDTLKDEQNSQIQDAQARVAAAQANLQGAQAALDQAKANRVNDTLKRADVQTAEASLRQAEAGLRTALANQKALDQRAEDIEANRASLRQSEAALQTAHANTRQVAIRRSNIVSQRAQLARAQEQASNALRNLQQTTVVAQNPGVVLKKYVDVGAIIQSGESGFSGGTSIVQLANTDRVYVDAQVDEADISNVRVGQRVTVTLDAYPDSPKTGVVRKIFPQAEVDSNVTFVKVQVQIDKADASLRPQLNATCDFVLQERKNVLSIPTEAIREEGGKAYVMVIKDIKKPATDKENQEKRFIIIGLRGDERSEVIKGLKPGETIIQRVMDTTLGPLPGGPGG
jgi:HlyD family secretion protein